MKFYYDMSELHCIVKNRAHLLQLLKFLFRCSFFIRVVENSFELFFEFDHIAEDPLDVWMPSIGAVF